MSMPHPQDKPSTADLVSAGDAQRTDPARPDKKMETEPPRNVRRMEPGARRDMEPRAGAVHEGEHPSALLPGNEASDMRRRWETIQTGFVDEPRRCVEEADSLVAQTMKRVAEVFAQERSNLEAQWSKGQDVSTEDLRVALKRYRSFFDRLLAV